MPSYVYVSSQTGLADEITDIQHRLFRRRSMLHSISCAAAAVVGDFAEHPGADVGSLEKVAKRLIPIDTIGFAH